METKIVDNFLTPDEIEQIRLYACKNSWEIQLSDYDAHEFLYMGVSDYELINDTIYKRIQGELGVGTELTRVYLNGQHCGREGKLHQDNCDVTALIYISEYNPNWGGFTQIMNSPTDQCIVPPIRGRLLLFDGNLFHKGYSFSYQDCPLRISLAYKINFK